MISLLSIKIYAHVIDNSSTNKTWGSVVKSDAGRKFIKFIWSMVEICKFSGWRYPILIDAKQISNSEGNSKVVPNCPRNGVTPATN